MSTVKEEQEELKREEKKAEKKKTDELNKLDMNKKNVRTYNSLLEDLLVRRLNMVEWPQGWWCTAGHTTKGVIMEIKDPEGQFYRSAFAPVVDPVYDLNAIDTYAARAENLIDQYNDERPEKGQTN